jgi:hypothetical protein
VRVTADLDAQVTSKATASVFARQAACSIALTQSAPVGIRNTGCGTAWSLRLPCPKWPSEASYEHPHTQIAAGLEQLVILDRVTFRYRDSLS